jgi:GH15 family glucan-1,4-alpha-glucosidase
MTEATSGVSGTQATRSAAARAYQQPPIEDYALIGDRRSAALVSRNGSIDWLCWPAFDSDACFAALLGGPENGRWQICPAIEVRRVQRRYRKDTLILETEFETAQGRLRLTDFMVPGERQPQLVRRLECLDGEVPVRSELSPRFSFGFAVPRVADFDHSTRAMAGPDAIYLRGGPRSGPPKLIDQFTVKKGEGISYVMTYGSSFAGAPPGGVDPVSAERATASYWTKWVSQIEPPSKHRDEIVRSLITIQACTYAPTGGLVAAPTTSLPETPGGVRNWDYRYTWLRDSVLAVRALMAAGLRDESRNFANWLIRAIAGDISQVQIMYGLRGERRLTEAEIPWLRGHLDSRPVRVGNGAYTQFQLDVFGEVAAVLRFSYERFKSLAPEAGRAMINTAQFAATHWRVPDRGIWEMRGPERSFTASKVSAWAAIDAAIRTVEETKLDYDVSELRKVRQEIFDEVMAKGWNPKLKTFTQYYGGTELDASLLFIPLLGFLPATDPRMVSTVEALEHGLMDHGLLLRFKADEAGAVDGLSGKEGVFLACSFWLADAYYLMGRKDDAIALFEKLLALSNDVGLLAEEYDPEGQRLLGNFPQAFSHFALVNCAYLLFDQKRDSAITYS